MNKPAEKQGKTVLSEEGLKYMWRTSIPEKWVNLKGKSYFHKVKEGESLLNHENSARTGSKYFKSSRLPERTEKDSLGSPKSEALSGSVSLQSLSHVSFTFEMPATVKKLTPKYALGHKSLWKSERQEKDYVSVLDLRMTTRDSEEKKHRMGPKALIAVKKKDQSRASLATDSAINTYLHRFDSPDTQPHFLPETRKGVRGWKIQKAKLPALSPIQSERRLAKTTRTETVSGVNMTEELEGKEPYLEYIRWRKVFPDLGLDE